jgi:hypothetical protein
MRSLASAALLACAACAGSTAASSGAPPEAIDAWAGTHELLAELERGVPTEVPRDAFHLRLSLEPEGAYRLREWERGTWQRDRSGTARREGHRLILDGAGAEPLELWLDPEGRRACLDGAVATAPAEDLEGTHRLTERLREGRPADQPYGTLTLEPAGRFRFEAPGGGGVTEGRYEVENGLLWLRAGDRPARAMAYWFADGRLVVCEGSFRARPVPEPS